MKLNWEENKSKNSYELAVGHVVDHVVHYTNFSEAGDREVQLAIENCIDKAVLHLADNINDDSRYLLFEWDVVYSLLTIVVTDDRKENDAIHVVKCSFTGIDSKFNAKDDIPDNDWENRVNEYAQDIKFWIKDYLSLCNGFLDYSLVAAFHCKNRASIELL